MPARVIEADKLAGFLRNGLSTNELSDLCDSLGLTVSGTKADKTERILVTISSWQELAGAMGMRLLRSALDYWEQDCRGTFATLSARAEEFVTATPAEFLDDPPVNDDGSLAWDDLEGDEDEDGDEDDDRKEADSPEGLPRLEATRDNVLQVLRTLKLGRVEDERDAQAQMFDVLHEQFGEVGRERIIGGFTMTSIDFEIAQTYGIEVKHTTGLFKQRRGHALEIERLLGQLVLYSRHYKREHTFVALVGPMEREQQAAFREIEKVVRDLGIEMVHVATR